MKQTQDLRIISDVNACVLTASQHSSAVNERCQNHVVHVMPQYICVAVIAVILVLAV
jgi:hypothetical protein